jgi:hypothetical protein
MFNILWVLFIAREYDEIYSGWSEHIIIPDDVARRRIAETALQWSIAGYTLIDSQGLWQGVTEKGYVLLAYNPPAIGFDGFINSVKTALNQKEILTLQLDCRQIPNWGSGGKEGEGS